MSSFTHTTTLLHAHVKTKHQNTNQSSSSSSSQQNPTTNRRKLVSTFLATSMAALAGAHAQPQALAQNWGTRSFLREHFFEPGLSPEDSVARIKQTAEGLHSMREMLENMSWRYVIFYIRLKQAYLDQDLKTAMATLPQGLRKDYVKVANELVDNMAELDRYVRSPKVYESYLYYERTLKSIDDLVAMLA
ncbi:photosynthetic NDH subunit of lumenal location 2, chloroplastic isoform X2 [Neltuma alba]|uniref:photosynthetic NDH subunit of lumenal location 2, chloroplastic isoform X2 n=1 Tax=Neltuma alba TaxID=207710 RepID=UPI0010A3BED2|nr:photosynthetic NDH subunit of lumenal location 2, chloroplastic isoform X2 [Prosopis alba]